jgi:hypothetical protein
MVEQTMVNDIYQLFWIHNIYSEDVMHLRKEVDVPYLIGC